MKKLLFIPLLCFVFSALAQNQDVLLTIADEKITADEFKRVYLKNNSGDVVSKSTVDEYLELYINFKLKVKEAEARGMDEDKDFLRELKGYRNQLAQPYLSEKNVLEGLKKQAYERLKYEVHASHILVKCKPQASPEDSLQAYKKALELRKQAQSKGFAKVAAESSDDPSAKQNNGDLGYFTAFYMVYPFESAAYNTEVGEISMPIRTRFGYHLVKVLDKRPSNGSMTAAHILISTDEQLSSTPDPEARANEIYARLTEGDSFEELAAQFSDDKRSATSGGILPPFSVGRMIKEFENAAFALEKDGDFTKPVKTKYGWHIIKRISKDGLAPYEDLEREIEQKVKKDSRSNATEGAAVRNIQKEYGFSENIKERNDFYKLLDTSYFGQDWDKSRFSKLKKTMFTIGKMEVNQQDFANFLNEMQTKKPAVNTEVYINDSYRSFKHNKIMEYKDSQLESEYPAFKDLVQEYHDGILLFNLTDELVWTKAVKDSTGLQNFYEKNKENYRWDKRVDAVVFSALDEKIASQTKKLINEGKSVSDILAEVNKSSQLNLKSEGKKYLKGDHELVDQVEWKKGLSKNIANNGRVSFVWIKEVLEPTYKTLEDSRGLITSDYQAYLESEWIKDLRSRYSFEVNQKTLNALKEELK